MQVWIGKAFQLLISISIYKMGKLGLIILVLISGCYKTERPENSDTPDQNTLASQIDTYAIEVPNKITEENFVIFSEGQEIAVTKGEDKTVMEASDYLNRNPFTEVYFTNDIEFIETNTRNRNLQEIYNFNHPSLNNIEWTLKQPLDLEGFDLTVKANSNADSVKVTYECINQKTSKRLLPQEGKIRDKIQANCNLINVSLLAVSNQGQIIVGGFFKVDVDFFNEMGF